MTVNAELLRETLAFIEANPDEWNQATFRCGTAGCFAWHAAMLAGSKPFPDPDFAFVIANDDDRDDRVVNSDVWHAKHAYRVVHVSDRAQRVLGLSENQADVLFHSTNELHKLRSIVKQLIEDNDWDPWAIDSTIASDIAEEVTRG